MTLGPTSTDLNCSMALRFVQFTSRKTYVVIVYTRGLQTTAHGQDVAREIFSFGPRSPFCQRKKVITNITILIIFA